MSFTITQEDQILNHLASTDREGKRRGITMIEALHLYQVASLSRRITTLSDKGYKIRKDRRTDPRGKRYVRYYLET